ncbi:UNVERIFIED_CONTAM: hypothetical protein FKN15_029259 [Acipenser sinensis]
MAVTRRGLPIESITGAEALVESCGDGEPQKKKRATEQSISSSRGETLGSPVWYGKDICVQLSVLIEKSFSSRIELIVPYPASPRGDQGEREGVPQPAQEDTLSIAPYWDRASFSSSMEAQKSLSWSWHRNGGNNGATDGDNNKSPGISSKGPAGDGTLGAGDSSSSPSGAEDSLASP